MPPFSQLTTTPSSSHQHEHFILRSYSSSDSSTEDPSAEQHDGQCNFESNKGSQEVGPSTGITVYSSPVEAPYAVIRSPPPADGPNDGVAVLLSKKNSFFVGEQTTHDLTPREINERLNLHLGQVWMNNEFERVRGYSRLWSALFLSWWEGLLLAVLYKVPDSILRSVIFAAWNAYLPVHRRLFHRSTGLDPSVSFECHALSTVLYLVHFAVTRASHIKYGLHILTAVRPSPPRGLVEIIKTTVQHTNGTKHPVTGRFVHHGDSKNVMTDYTIMWIYGGAFMSGDAHGNVGTADVLGQSCHMDVWIADYRKAPTFTMDDILEDVMCAYQWIRKRRVAAGLDPSKIVLVGWSAGAALCTRLMQSLGSSSEMPKTAVLMSPFVRYEPPAPESSMHHYSLHDWLVTRNIMEVAEEALDIDKFWGNENEAHSPLSHSMSGLPPLCVIVSEHEAVYDETICLVENARRDHVALTMGVWRYMPHGWYMFGGLLPEGQRALKFASQHIQDQCYKL